MTEPVVDRETADAEFQRFCEEMALEFDVASMVEEDRKGFLENRKRFVDAVCSGQLTVGDNGEPTLKLSQAVGNIGAITFHEPTGATFRALDGKGKTADVQKQQALIAQMCRTSVATIEGMRNRDLRIANAVFVLFLA